jgi:hypothetical protein
MNEEVVKYRKFQYETNERMKLTGDDLMIVMDCNHCGPDLTDEIRKECLCCGDGWVREDYTLCIIGNDVISLFPSLDSVNTGRIVREEVARSTMEIDGFSTKLGLRYIAMNEEYTSDLDKIRKLMPRRLTKPGVKPTMKCKWVNNKEVLDDDDWIYPPITPTREQTRWIQGHVAEIGTRMIFENFVYQFGGVAYHQQQGGPIGARVTMCAARMVMQHWARGYEMILLKAGLRIPLLGGYVDDGRQGSTVLRRGMLFDHNKKEFVYSEEQRRIDEMENEPDNRRMARVCLPAMNAVNEDLKFTTECPEDFPRQRLPTLDFVLWMVGGLLYHSYFEKAMVLQYTIMSREAMNCQQYHQELQHLPCPAVNDLWHKGLHSLSSLLRVMPRRICYPVAFVWDFSKAYHSIYTSQREKFLRLIVWRFGKSEEDWKTGRRGVSTEFLSGMSRPVSSWNCQEGCLGWLCRRQLKGRNRRGSH